jgi:hypothetical protein
MNLPALTPLSNNTVISSSRKPPCIVMSSKPTLRASQIGNRKRASYFVGQRVIKTYRRRSSTTTPAAPGTTSGKENQIQPATTTTPTTVAARATTSGKEHQSQSTAATTTTTTTTTTKPTIAVHQPSIQALKQQLQQEPPPVSPSRSQLIGMPLPPATSPRYMSVLPDPMAEFAMQERQYKEDQKNLHGSTIVASCVKIYNRHQLHLALKCWALDTQRKQEHALQCQFSAQIIALGWKNYQNKIILVKYNNANACLKRNLLRIIVFLKQLKTRRAARLVTTFVKQTVGPRFKTVIQTLRWKVIVCQRFVRDYLACSKARLKVLRMRFEKRVKIRCDEIRNINIHRSQEYADLKSHLQLEQLRNVEEKWHDAHARVKNVMQVALTAASRAKRRRMKFKKQMKAGEAAAALQQAKLDTLMQQVEERKLEKQKEKQKKQRKFRPPLIIKDIPVLANVGAVASTLQNCADKNKAIKTAAKRSHVVQPNAQIDAVEDDQYDALALQYMHLPTGIRSSLCRNILKKYRQKWIEFQDEKKRIYSHKVEIHRPIDCEDVKKMLKGDLHAMDLEKETIVRWKRKPLELWRAIANDLDVAIDIAITHCVWDC